jgi:hypothetical protein
MASIANVELAFWYLSLVLQASVVFYLLTRKLVSTYPGLFAYLIVNTLQACLLMAVYRRWGLYDIRSEHTAWISEIPVLLMRAWAIADICRLLLRPYRGIWGMAWRVLVGLALLLVCYSILSAGQRWDHAVLQANISLELTTILLLVALFLFARYYQVPASIAIRALALGFLIYSSFTILNDKILQHWMGSYVAQWEILGTLPFLGSVCLWLWAVRQPAAQTTSAPLLPRDVYFAVTPEVNLRLRLLDERLSRFWNPEAHRP